nr:protein byr4 [Quercus suber]
MATTVESWDDNDFQGDFQTSVGTSIGANTSLSSRMSVRSESVGGDDDWNVVLTPDDEQSSTFAMQSANRVGIPLPSNIPSSALLGGTIKRLGKKKSRQRVADDWDNDLEMPDGGTLTLKPKAMEDDNENMEDFDDLEGSLGIRFARSTSGARARSSSASAMSPSMGSVMVESEEDDLKDLELPEGPMDFEAILKKRRAADAELSDMSQASPAIEQPSTMNHHKKSKLLSDDNDDFMNDFELGSGDFLDGRKRVIHKNLKVKPSTKPSQPAHRTGTTISFHEKATDKPLHTRSHLPRPVSGSKPSSSRLEPVLESGASHHPRERRQPMSTSAQLLRSKRSMPALGRPTSSVPSHKTSLYFQAAESSSPQPSNAAAQRAMPYHLRRDSDPNNRRSAQSPPLRSHSRLSNAYVPDTPSRVSRSRPDVAPAALARAAAAKRTVTKPARKRNFGDGSELQIFDDLPTSTIKESKFVKQPVTRAPARAPGLRQTQSRSDMKDVVRRNVPDRTTAVTPAPRTPASPTKGFGHEVSNYTPSYLRDTAASRRAREQTLGNTNLNGNSSGSSTAISSNIQRPRSQGPLMPLTTNWKAQVAARSPHTSPSTQRHKPRSAVQPTLIKGLGPQVAKTEKGMTYNPHTLRWEGNENTLTHFDMPPPLETPTPTGRHHERLSYLDHQAPLSSSPPRPALIAPMSGTAGVQVNGGMVFDPHQMKWLKFKAGRDVSGPLMSPSNTDGEEEDTFAGIEDLKDNESHLPVPLIGGSAMGTASPLSIAADAFRGGPAAPAELPEEFDLGPRFIQVQRDEESVWRKRCEKWFSADGVSRLEDERWRWAIRDVLPTPDNLDPVC